MTVFKNYAAYYDLLYDDKDYEAEADFVKKILDQHAFSTQTILELGCGSGRHAICLAKKGYFIHAIDRSDNMLFLAKEKTTALPKDEISRLTWTKGDICHLEPDQQYDTVISLFHVMNYQTDDTDLTGIFNAVEQFLKPGGIFIFDSWHGPAVRNNPPETRIKRAQNEDIHITRICEPKMFFEKNIVDVNYTFFVEHQKTKKITTFSETHKMRYLFSSEIENFSHKSDLTVIETNAWMTDTPPEENSFSVYYVLKKKYEF